VQYWLMKTEPSVFSIDDLIQRPNQTEHWDGVRNYQARNFMRDQMKKGDLILLYHSNAGAETGIVGIARVEREAYPDHTALDPKSHYYFAKATIENNPWCMIDIKFVEKFKSPILLTELKKIKELQEMKLLQKGNRLSVLPIAEREFLFIQKQA